MKGTHCITEATSLRELRMGHFVQRAAGILYAFFWVIPQHLNFICRRFGTHCSIFIGG